MWFLYILGGLIVLITLILFLPIRIWISVSDTEGLVIEVRILGYLYERIPQKTKRVRLSDYTPRAIERRRRKASKQANKASRKKSISAEPSASLFSIPKRTAPLSDQLSFALEFIRVALKRTLSHARIYVNRLVLTIGSDDAAKTALLCGTAKTALGALCELLDSYSHLRIRQSDRFGVIPDFTSEHSQAQINIVARLWLWQILDIEFRTAWESVSKMMEQKSNIKSS
jgi:hypothetical protein